MIQPRPGSAGRRAISLISLAALLVALAVTAVLSVITYVSTEHTEARLLKLKVAEVGAVLQVATSAIQTPLAAGAEFATGAPAEAGAAFEHFIRGYVGSSPDPFVSASLWQVGGVTQPKLLDVVGSRPRLAATPSEAATTLAAAHARTGVAIAAFLHDAPRRLGYAYAPSGADPQYAVYAEAALPPTRQVTTPPGSPFSDLRFQLYLGNQAHPADLLEANAASLGSRTEQTVIPFGDSALTIVAASHGPMVGALAHSLWWIIAVAGGLLSIAAALISERLVRRGRAAEALTGEVRALLGREREVSEALQRAMVPAPPPAVANTDIAVRYLTSAKDVEIGGDWYDAQPLDDGRLFLAIGDVSGRGVEAGTVMASLRAATRAYVTEGHGPAAVLDRLGRLLHLGTDGHFATVQCAVLDRARRELTVSTAGHPPPLVLGTGADCFLSVPPGPPIGALIDPPRYEDHVFPLPDDATVVLFTDGLIERHDSSLDEGFERLRIVAQRQHGTVDEMLGSIVSELGGGAAADDTAVMAVRWTS